jgi:SRSO17 transposase
VWVATGLVQAAHQSLHHFVANAEWSDKAVLVVVRAHVLPVLERQGPIRAWLVGDTTSWDPDEGHAFCGRGTPKSQPVRPGGSFFRTEAEIPLDQIRAALSASVP